MATRKKNSKKKTAGVRSKRTVKVTLLSQTELARVFGVTTQTIRNWVVGGLPRDGEQRGAKYPLEPCISWVRTKDREEAAAAARPQSYEEARTRKAIADAEMSEYDLLERRKELMTVEQYHDALQSAYSRVSAQVRTLEMRLSPEIIGLKTLRQARKKIAAVVTEVLDVLHGAEDVPGG